MAPHRFPTSWKLQASGIDKVTGLLEELGKPTSAVFHRPLDYRIADSIKPLRKAESASSWISTTISTRSIPPLALSRSCTARATTRAERPALHAACQLADVVTCSTPAIERRWGFVTYLARNGIPPHVLEMEYVEEEESAGLVPECFSCWRFPRLSDVSSALEETGLPFTAVIRVFSAAWPGRVSQRSPDGRPPESTNIAKLDIGTLRLLRRSLSSSPGDQGKPSTRRWGSPVASLAAGVRAGAEIRYLLIARSPDQWR